MARRKNDNMGLKSMEEFNCKISIPKFALAALIAILIALLFLPREFSNVVQAETTSTNLVNQVDTKQQKSTEPANLDEASDIAEADETVESAEATEDAESSQTIESADYVESVEKAMNITSSLESISLKRQQLYESFIIPVAEKDIELAARVVIHEVTASRSYYPDADIDDMQQCMARVIINQVIEGRWGDCIYDIVFYPGHFEGVEYLRDPNDWKPLDPYEEELTMNNVLKVLRGEDSHSSNFITIEMSFPNTQTFDESIEVMESQVGPVDPYLWTVCAENRLLIFAEEKKD